MTLSADAINPKALRRSLALNQSTFWGRIGVQQSAGSRYESGRRLPKPVLQLLRLTYIERIDLSRINAADLQLVEYIRTFRPELYRNLLSALSAANPGSTVASPQGIPALTTSFIERSIAQEQVAA